MMHDDFLGAAVALIFPAAFEMIHDLAKIAVDERVLGQPFGIRIWIEIVELDPILISPSDHIPDIAVMPLSMLEYSVLLIHAHELVDKLPGNRMV